ncbi:MAG: T9SS type A sorting domain-containing protein [Bacteroidales bacterium]|nr:T9SS type A sorting domain-containing protein [Bacteroidales bacterium]
MKRLHLTLFVFTFLCGINLNSQEWEFQMDTQIDYPYHRKFNDAIELQDGSIVVNTPITLNIPSHASVPHPGLVKISADGTELARNNYFRPAYCSISYNQILENENGELFALMTYSPDHEKMSDNYFQNFDNPPTNAILGLYKLDDELNIVESYEHYIPIDTTEYFGSLPDWDNMPNEISGRLYLFTSFIDNAGNIVGSFFKCPPFYSPYQTENDSMFFFKMNFEGEIIQMKGIECLTGHGDYWRHRGHSMVETDLHYILYQVLEHNDYNFSFIPSGEAWYFDKDLNFVDKKAIRQPGYANSVTASLEYVSVVRSKHNTVYLASVARSVENPNSHRYDDNRLYEIEDNLDNSTDLLPIVQYITRGVSYSKDHQPLNNGIVLKEDNTLIYVQNWNLGDRINYDSWVVIEHLDENFETISEMYYTSGEDGNFIEVNSIVSTKEEDLLLVGYANSLNGDKSWNFVTKFPASAFVNIEEAHANNLHLAVAYPNPGGDVMNIRTSLRNCTLQVYDMQGRIIHQQEITDEVTSIDASKWSLGTYIWKLTVNNEQLTVEEGKWIK